MAVLELREGQVGVLLNNHFPIISFAVPPNDRETGPLRFMDCEELGNVFRTSGRYEVMRRDELESAVNKSELQQLRPAEIEQADYWQPQRVGDVVFNFWD